MAGLRSPPACGCASPTPALAINSCPLPTYSTIDYDCTPPITFLCRSPASAVLVTF